MNHPKPIQENQEGERLNGMEDGFHKNPLKNPTKNSWIGVVITNGKFQWKHLFFT